jgi:hypothetical protein
MSSMLRKDIPNATKRRSGVNRRHASAARRQTQSTYHFYTPDQAEFVLAMDAYKRDHHRPFPTWIEVMDVFLSLGYRKH